MGVKIKDYILAINKQKHEAIMNGKKLLTIRAGELHSQYGEKGSPTMLFSNEAKYVNR